MAVSWSLLDFLGLSPSGHLVAASAVALLGALTVILAVVSMRASGQLSPIVARKLMHIATGPTFCVIWLMFPSALRWQSSISAAIVPAALTLYFVLNGLGKLHDYRLINTVSRTGDRKELLQGPLYYGIVHVLACLFFWRDHPAGLISLMVLCVGDGFADIAGRKWGKTSLPWSSTKTWAGSAAFLVTSIAATIPVGLLFLMCGAFSSVTTWQFLSGLPVVVAVCALVESLPFADIDNITVFIAAVAASKWVW